MLIGDLIRRRGDVIADTEELSRKLSAAVEQHRSAGIELPESPEDLMDHKPVDSEPGGDGGHRDRGRRGARGRRD